MSFLKYDDKNTTNNVDLTKNPMKVAGYENSDSTISLEPVARPVDTVSFDLNKNLDQKEVCSKLKKEQPQLFQESSVIVKQIGNEKQYKQMQQFSSKATVESLIKVMEESNLVLRCNFIRPGFNARNSCLMCTVEDLKQMLKNPENDFNLKSVKLNVSNDDSFSPKHGTMFLSASKDRSGQHLLYSLDYHINEDRDKVLYSIH
ncbi:MAG: hypothetical protein CMO44_18490 [Verrucomicrobiales bacterium]|nr:hypothetical protein [Verrucomicrobiales bacterium]